MCRIWDFLELSHSAWGIWKKNGNLDSTNRHYLCFKNYYYFYNNVYFSSNSCNTWSKLSFQWKNVLIFILNAPFPQAHLRCISALVFLSLWLLQSWTIKFIALICEFGKSFNQIKRSISKFKIVIARVFDNWLTT